MSHALVGTARSPAVNPSSSVSEKPARPDTPSTPAQADFARLDRLRDELAGLFPVPEASVQAYTEAAEALTRRVDAALAARDDLPDLIGPAPVEAMHANHRHHIRFMQAVFDLNQPNLLVLTVPWVYRSYTSHGFSPDYFPVELEAWRSAVEDTLPAAAAEPVAAVYRWLVDHHEDHAALAQDPAVTPVRRTQRWSDEAQSLLSALLDADTKTALAQMTDAVRSRQDLARFGVQTAQPVMYAVGSLWERDQATVAQEHLATAVVARGMAAAYMQCDAVPTSKGRALLTCAVDEHHELGGRILADALEADGWETTFLGANTPTADLVAMAADLRPDLVGVSVAMAYNLPHARGAIQAIRQHAALARTRIMVGGLATAAAPEVWRPLGADGTAGDAREAVLLAQRWWKGAA